MRKKFILFTFIILFIIEFSDAWRRGGGGKIRFPTKIRSTHFVGSTNYRNKVLKCYSCDNSVDARLCAINPQVYAKQILCRKDELCSVERQELPAGVGFTKEILSGGIKTYGTKTTESTSAPNKVSSTQVSIWRGCKSPESKILAGTSPSFTAHFCAKDLCNHGDGHLRCFECSGIGIYDKCMVNPSVFANQVTCQPNEACYVERFSVQDNFMSSTQENQWVSRGCIQSGVVDVTKYRSNNSITVVCRIGDFCNMMDARTIAVDSTSELRVSLASVGLAFLFTSLMIPLATPMV